MTNATLQIGSLDNDEDDILSTATSMSAASDASDFEEVECSIRGLEGFTMTPLSPADVVSNGNKPSNGCVQAASGITAKRSRHYDITVLSALYAKLLVVLGISLPLSEVISPRIPPSFYMGFYLYLFFGCIAFLLYAYLFLIRRNGSTVSVFQLMFSKTKSGEMRQEHIAIEAPRSCGSFYLRVGAIAFGIGSMIYSGLEFVQFFEFDPNATCYNVTFAIVPVVHMAFTFIQLYFIFLNSKVRTYKYKNLARFGLMHMVATNLCVWLLTVIQESKFEIQHLAFPNLFQDHEMALSINDQQQQQHHLDHNVTLFTEFINGTMNYTLPVAEAPRITRCRRMRVLGQLVQNISPLLFPCSIQYSLIGAAICYIMWKNIKVPKLFVNQNGLMVNPGSPDGSVAYAKASSIRRHHHHYRVDCTGSIKGLFTGILILVLVIISIILYFVLINKQEYRHLAVVISHVSEMGMCLLTIPVPIWAMLKIRHFRYHAQKNVELDNILLIFAQVGIYLFSIFSMIGGHLSPDGIWLLVLGSSVTRLVQATIQTVFVLDASHRTASTNEQVQRRPGRELITFLLVCNFALWLISTLETGRADSHPLQLRFFGFWGWTVISNFCSPLAIFFRFHSTVCLCEIWKKIYKHKNERV